MKGGFVNKLRIKIINFELIGSNLAINVALAAKRFQFAKQLNKDKFEHQ